MRLQYPIIIYIFILLIQGCANVSSPQGGPEDETPPQLISSVPDQEQTNYQGQTILLNFDEWVNTRNIETEVIITPRIVSSFKTKVKKNQVEITFFEPLLENTTYAVSFGGTIRDVTNNNPAENLNLSFSTGPYIDSLQISGTIKSLIDQEPAEEVLVALYDNNDSTNILNGVASYFTLTDTTGNYQFRNLRPGTYRIYAARDDNNNNRADSQSERYGFYPDSLMLTNNIENIDFTIQNLNTTEIKTLNARHFGEYFDITFNKQFTDFQILTVGNFYYRPEGPDKMRFFRNDRTYGDTLDLIYQVKDSLNTILQDTVGLYFSESKIDKTDFTISTDPATPQASPTDTLIFKFSKPIVSYNLDSISINLDSTRTFTLNPQLFRFNQYRTELNTGFIPDQQLNEKDVQLTIITHKAAFISADQDSSKRFEKKYNHLEESETAVISGQVISSSANVIIQLLSANNKRVLRETNTKTFEFSYLPAGRYMVRVIDDRNGNGRLDIGNILTNEVPEDVHYYFDTYYKTKVIEVRKNWANSDINISF
ncbi:Ig-like domain-containing protein [Roseivirga sp.]|uniref:Ig-like domain-containing protein n=1 Tax=Roseivirga sp. TaxID=1964215 RepID=UPI003B52FDC1